MICLHYVICLLVNFGRESIFAAILDKSGRNGRLMNQVCLFFFHFTFRLVQKELVSVVAHKQSS